MPANSTRTAGSTASGGLDHPESAVVVSKPDERKGDIVALLASGLRLVRGLLLSRLGLVSTAAAIVIGGLALGWGWLAAVEVLPFVLSVLPCVAMCALGLCMMKGRDGTCANRKDSGSAGGVSPASRL